MRSTPMRLGVAVSALALLPATAAVATPAAAATPTSSYVVVLKEPVASAQALAGGRITRRFDNVPAFTADLSDAQARRLAGDPAVRVVEKDRVVRIAATQQNPVWGLDRIDQRSRSLSHTFTPMDDGSSVHAYILDTGVRMTHRQFGGRAVSGYDFIDDDHNASDCNGHGTHVAGTVGGSTYGVAKKAKIVSVRVLNCKGAGLVSTIIAGIDWVTKHAVKPAVANLSLGAEYDAALDAAVEEAIGAGVTFVVAAGNSDDDAYYYSPAGVPAAITVGATDARDRRAPFSNYGSIVDLFAPGVGVRSAWKTSDTATAELSGTSMATPHVTGAAALVLDAYPSLTPKQVRDWLVKRSTTGKVTDRAGSPDRLLYLPPPVARPVVATTSLPAATVGEPYSARLAVTVPRRGSWQVLSGSLPPGLTLSASGVVSGTPTTAITKRLTVRFTDYVPYQVNQAVTVSVRA